MTDQCSVCGTEMKEYVETIDWGGPICEHVATCPNGCYSYEFSYGYTTIHVGDLRFGWSYSDDKETVKAQTDAIDAACTAARQLKDQNEGQAQRPQEPR